LKVLVDATPIAINRTAVYHIAWDIIDYFSQKYGASVLIYDRILSSEEIEKVRMDCNTDLIRRAQKGVSDFLHSNRNKKNVRFGLGVERHCVIYLDPLYCLFDRSIDDSVVLVHDLTPLTHPSWHEPMVCESYKRAYAKIQESRASLVALSHSTARDLWVNFGISRHEIRVAHLYLRKMKAHLTADSDDFTNYEKKFLFVGSLEERKNIKALIMAFHLSGLQKSGFSLIIVGGDGYGNEEIRQLVAKVKGVKLAGFLDDRDLEILYRTSWAFVYPSMWEGFGLPLLEAMARGLPCIASSHSAVREVGADAALFIQASDVDSISKALIQSSKWEPKERESYMLLSLERSKDFSFEKFISIIEDAVIEICARKSGEFFDFENENQLPPSFLTFPWIEQFPKSLGDIPESHSEAYLILILQLARIRMERRLTELSKKDLDGKERSAVEKEFSSIEFAIEARIRELKRLKNYKEGVID